MSCKYLRYIKLVVSQTYCKYLQNRRLGLTGDGSMSVSSVGVEAA